MYAGGSVMNTYVSFLQARHQVVHESQTKCQKGMLILDCLLSKNQCIPQRNGGHFAKCIDFCPKSPFASKI